MELHESAIPLYSSIAQSVEHAAVNRGVVGSSPTGGAKARKCKTCGLFYLPKSVEKKPPADAFPPAEKHPLAAFFQQIWANKKAHKFYTYELWLPQLDSNQRHRG